MKRKNILFSVILMASAVTGFQGIAKADYVDDIINETNALTGAYTTYERNVLAPAIQQRNQYLQALASLCSQGNTSACSKYNAAVEAESQRLSDAVDHMRNRGNQYYQ